jgi:hypothetical protein
MESIWIAIHRIQPMLVGGCRPIDLLGFVTEPRWKIRYNNKLIGYGVPSEVLVAEKMAIG